MFLYSAPLSLDNKMCLSLINTRCGDLTLTLKCICVLAAVASWSVSYNPTGICAFEGSSVDFSCSFDYPDYLKVTVTKWFRPDKYQKQDGSQQGITVYHSNAAYISRLYRDRTAYANQDKNCSLRVRNVSKGDVGRYFFRTKTNYYNEKFTGSGGIHLKVAGK